MTARRLLSLNTATPQVLVPQTGDTYLAPVTLQAATGDEVALDLAVVVNKLTSGNYTGLKLNVTETAAPGSDDRLLDLGVGGTSKIVGTNAGQLRVGAGTAALPSLSFIDDPNTGFYSYFADNIGVATNGNVSFLFGSGGQFAAKDGVTLGPNVANPDVVLKRSAAGVLGIHNSITGVGGASIKLDLTTEDRSFIDFAGTADADATSAISTFTTSAATTHHIQIAINGVKAWVAASTSPPTA